MKSYGRLNFRPRREEEEPLGDSLDTEATRGRLGLLLMGVWEVNIGDLNEAAGGGFSTARVTEDTGRFLPVLVACLGSDLCSTGMYLGVTTDELSIERGGVAMIRFLNLLLSSDERRGSDTSRLLVGEVGGTSTSASASLVDVEVLVDVEALMRRRVPGTVMGVTGRFLCLLSRICLRLVSRLVLAPGARLGSGLWSSRGLMLRGLKMAELSIARGTGDKGRILGFVFSSAPSTSIARETGESGRGLGLVFSSAPNIMSPSRALIGEAGG